MTTSGGPRSPSGLADAGDPFAAQGWSSGPAAPDLRPDAWVTRERNRWSDDGEPTVYIAGDPGVALAEIGRHQPETPGDRIAFWTVQVSLGAALDFRDPAVRDRWGLSADPRWLLDRGRCRGLAARVRRSTRVEGIVVPSVACLDDWSRWNVVVFVERLEDGLAGAIRPLRRAFELVPDTGRLPEPGRS
jgi:RES domain-containing protein